VTPSTFELQPTLRGDLVVARPLRAEDYAALYAVAADPLLWEQHPQPDRFREPVFAGFFRDAMASGGALLVTDATTSDVIGTSRFARHDEEARSIEIGWTFLARSHWGGRYNGELKELMLSHAFRFVERVHFVVGPHNVRSQRALTKIGAKRVGWRNRQTGEERCVFEVTATAFAEQQRQRQGGRP
jgi:RimJ/RimL family protein N-acetyltransferase